MILLFPNDPLAPARPDEHFAPEAESAAQAGIEVRLVDHDALVGGHIDESVRRVRSIEGQAVYRGWMVTSPQYAALAAALDARGVVLRTSPGQYQAAHELPGWHEHFAEHTAPSAWTSGGDLDAVHSLVEQLPAGGAVVKDYVKSLKHHWETAMHVADLGDDAEIRRVVSAFVEERGTDLVGGLVLRAFEDYQPGEARTWWVDGRCALITAHPDTPHIEPDVPNRTLDALAPAVSRLGSPFITADIARRADGRHRVVEVGDGQVSDRPRSTDPTDFIRALVG